MNKDYYQLLGISRSASPEEIKKAYRKLAHQHHPDKAGGSAERFKEINEAYQILSDPNKKAQYDQFGSVGPSSSASQGGWGGFDPSGFGGFNSQGVKFDFGFGGGGGFSSIFEDLFDSAFSRTQVQLTISVAQAVLGDKIVFKTQLGDTLELRLPAGTQEGATFAFPSKGQPTRRGRGDLHVSIHIDIPKRLSREERELYERLKNLS